MSWRRSISPSRLSTRAAISRTRCCRRVWIDGKIVEIDLHVQCYCERLSGTSIFSPFSLLFRAFSASYRRLPDPFGRAPVNAFDQHGELRGGQRDRVVAPADRRHTHVRLLRLAQDGELFLVSEAAPVRTSVAWRIAPSRVCQGLFGCFLLSSAANAAAYFRASAGMKIRAPVNLHFAAVEQITLAAQTDQRKIVSVGAMRGAQSAPVQRFDMHRPERLNGDRALRFAQRRWPSTAALTTLFAQKFCCFSRGFRAFELLEPAIERRLVEPMIATIFGARKSAPARRFNMRRPVGTPCRVLELFRAHRRSSHVRENPICREIALPSERAEFGHLRCRSSRRTCIRLRGQD